MRGLKADDEGAAAVGILETTLECRPYPHPDNPCVMLWDLPGVGTENFPRETYLRQVEFDKYDFFLILTKTRFTENDLWLAKEVKAQGKRFFLIRTKIDQDMANDKEDHPRTHDETRALETVREDCLSNLHNHDLLAKVFLISGRKRFELRWEFADLKTKLLEHIGRLKRHTLVLTFNADSTNVIEQKYGALYRRILLVASLASAVAAVPIPGLGFDVDVGLVAKEVQSYVSQLNLDKDSLQKLSNMYRIPIKEFQDCVNSVIQELCFNDIGMVTYVRNEMSESFTAPRLHDAVCLLPIVGSVVSSVVAYKVTAATLRRTLDTMKEAALKVLDMIMKSSMKDLE